MTTIDSQPLTLRATRPGDRDFLLGLYAAVRAAELDQVAWAPGARQAFLVSQFDLQDHHYRTTHPRASFDVVEVGGHPVGRWYVDRGATDIRVIDVALVPEWCGRGIGSRLLGEVLAEAAASGRTASIHVEIHNPAGALYARLGFQEVGVQGVYRLLQWRDA